MTARRSCRGVRRVPVVDAQGRVCGIVAQDIARIGNMQEIAERVQDVSQPERPY